jgi:propanediol dehydratase large subunit
VDINLSRDRILELISGCTPAKLVEIVGNMNVLEMMMGPSKMRARHL